MILHNITIMIARIATLTLLFLEGSVTSMEKEGSIFDREIFTCNDLVVLSETIFIKGKVMMKEGAEMEAVTFVDDGP